MTVTAHDIAEIVRLPSTTSERAAALIQQYADFVGQQWAIESERRHIEQLAAMGRVTA